MKAIVLHSVVPVRADASEESEQLTQLLFGETCTILDEKPRWKRVKSDLDGQEGWVDFKMITRMTDAEYADYAPRWQHTIARVCFPVAFAMSGNNGQTIPLTMGTRLPDYRDGQFAIMGVPFRIQTEMVAPEFLELTPENLMQVTRFMLNVPYLWGGKNALGMDCSGFTQIIHSLFGHDLLRNAREQITQGQEIDSLSAVKPGDLAFFDHEDGRITHVGLLLDSERVMHCSGRIKIEKIDQSGIWSVELADPSQPNGVLTHHLAGIRRY